MGSYADMMFDSVCGQKFLLETPEEVPEGYCQISCGRCPCCQTFSQVLHDSAWWWGWMVNLTEFGPQTALPGFMATMLVPSDDAVRALMSSLGEWGVS
jgi:hypothetical protein